MAPSNSTISLPFIREVTPAELDHLVTYPRVDGRAVGPDGETVVGKFTAVDINGSRVNYALELAPEWSWLCRAIRQYRPYVVAKDDVMTLAFHDHSHDVPMLLEQIPNKAAYELLDVPLSTWTKWCTSGFPPLVDRQQIPKIVRVPPNKIYWNFWELMMWRYNTRDSLRILHSINNVHKRPKRLWRKDGSYNQIR